MVYYKTKYRDIQRKLSLQDFVKVRSMEIDYIQKK